MQRSENRMVGGGEYWRENMYFPECLRQEFCSHGQLQNSSQAEFCQHGRMLSGDRRGIGRAVCSRQQKCMHAIKLGEQWV
jgi:hypothetical protein